MMNITEQPLMLEMAFLSAMVFLVCLMNVGGQVAFADEALSNIPLDMQWVERQLPDDAIVALVDFKFKVLEKGESGEATAARFTGEATRFITGADKEKKFEFDGMLNRPIYRVPTITLGPDKREIGVMTVQFEEALAAGEAKNCLLIYQRNKDGTAKIISFETDGANLAPAYEWLENTKDRMDDRPTLAAVVLMDKDAPSHLRALAYRIVAFSNLWVKSRVEIFSKAYALVPNEKGYAAFVLANLAFSKHASRNDNIFLLRHFLNSLTAAKSADVKEAEIWLSTIETAIGRMDQRQYRQTCKEIADTLKKHDVTPLPPSDRGRYDKLKKIILDRVEPTQSSPEGKPALPADGGAKPAPPADNNDNQRGLTPLVIAGALAEGQELAIKLVPERKVYMLGEKIYFGLFIENVSDHSAMIPTTWSIEPTEGYLVSVEIEGYPHLINPFYDSGDELPSSLVLDAGAVYHEYFSLWEWNFSGFNQPGKYKIRAIYQVRAEKTGKYWRGKVMSDWVEFEIAAPKTDADKAAYAMLSNNGKMPSEYLRGAGDESVPVEILEKVMNGYPNSVYGRIACESLVERYVYGPVDVPTLRKYREFAQQHWPEDILLSVIDASIAQRMAERDDKKEATEVIDRLLEKPQNARVLRMLRSTVRNYDLIVGNPKALGPFQDGWKPPTKQEKPKPVETKPAAETAVPAAPGLVLHSTSGFPWYNYALIALAIICASAAAYFIISKRKNAKPRGEAKPPAAEKEAKP